MSPRGGHMSLYEVQRPKQQRNGQIGPARLPQVAASSIVGAKVMLGQLRVGNVRDALLGADLSVVLGLVVETPIGRRCFLPWAGAHVQAGEVVLASPTLLLGDVELDYYLGSGIAFDDVEGVCVGSGPRPAFVTDVTFGRNGATAGVVLTTHRGRMITIPVEDIRVRWSRGRVLELGVRGARRVSDPNGAEGRARAAAGHEHRP